jgi:YtxH-like protein
MVIKEIIDHLQRREDLERVARYFGSLRRPARAELLMFGLAGALIGAGVALLFAPERGSELRRRIGDQIDEVMRMGARHEANGHDRAEGT